MELEIAISMLFDVINIFSQAKDDTYRQIKWKDTKVFATLDNENESTH